MKKQSKNPPILTSVAGEYFVAAELSRRGYVASITLRNTRGMDILATNLKATRSITIQCKTARKGGRGWMLSEKCEKDNQRNHFYVFVVLGDPKNRPSYHIVPSSEVAKRVKAEHRNWKRRPGRNGQKHANTPVRNFRDIDNEFLEKWDSLEL